jgi:hypothetical protein
MCLWISNLLTYDAIVYGEAETHTFTLPAVGNDMEVSYRAIIFEKPILTDSLYPMFLFCNVNLENLFLKMAGLLVASMSLIWSTM